tara:strand:- start:386 stop:613 length:228 start_codon:yes stop_codon:yes gene_type:complete
MNKFLVRNFIFFLFNSTLFVFLFIGMQNSKENKRINFLFFETMPMPISFITGTSFIVGGIFSNLYFSALDLNSKR